MSASLSRILRRSLTTFAIGLCLLTASSFFFGASVSYQLKTAQGGGDAAWVRASFDRGVLGLGYERCSSPLAEALEKMAAQNVPGIHRCRIGRRWMINVISLKLVSFNWWFRSDNTDLQVHLTGGPARMRAATYPFHYRRIVAPCWFFLLLAGAYPLYRLIDLPNQRLRKRFAAGQCLACGYDLRHTPDRCPECGLVPTKVPPPRRSIPFRAPDAIGPAIWWRILFYPVFFTLFTVTFCWGYYRYYQK